MRENRQIKKM